MFTFWDVSIFGTLLGYGLLVDCRLLSVWCWLLAVYVALSIWVGGKGIHLRRRVEDMASYRPPTDPNVYARMEVCLEKVDEFIERKKREGVTVTYTHIGLRAMGAAFAGCMRDNGKIVFGKFIPLPSIDIAILVNVGNGKDLSAYTVRNCDSKSISEIQRELSPKVTELRSTKDNVYVRKTRLAE